MKDVVGRAELKLAEAVKAFRYDFRGKTVLDIGSSTGEFTEFALKNGAKRVIAIEKGTNQMVKPLRYDSRVALYEKMDFLMVRGVDEAGELVVCDGDSGAGHGGLVNRANNVTAKQGRKDGELVKRLQVDTVLADVSFVSLRKILLHAREIVTEGTDYLVMLKPQFEAYPDQLVNGKVKNEKMRREIIRQFEEWLRGNGFVIVNKRDNETRGKVSGNRERFYWLRGCE